MSQGSMHPGEQGAPPFDPSVFSAPSSTESLGSEPSEGVASLDPFLPSSVLGLHDTSLDGGLLPSDIKHETAWESSDLLQMELQRVSALSLSTPISHGRRVDTEEPPVPAPAWCATDLPLAPENAHHAPAPIPAPATAPPMTPMSRQERSGRYVQAGHPPLSTPEYPPMRHHSVCSPSELTSPALVPESMSSQRLSFDQSPSPQKSASLPVGVDMGLPPGVPWMPPPGFLDDPFIPMPTFTPPASMMFMDPGTPQHGPHSMARVYSAPVMPSWPHDSPGSMPGLPQTPMAEPVSFPVSPASGGVSLPVSSVAMARKGYTPYAKSPGMYWSHSDMEHFSSPMSASKSTSALASPLPLSPSTPSAPRRRGGRISHSVSMPGDQMPGMLDFEGPSPARQRGRQTGPPPLVVSSADKLHVCHCGRRFKRMEHLKRHTRTHTQERPHKCPVASCGKSFGRSDNLSQHLKTHFRPSGLVGRTNELLSLHEDSRKTDARHDPYAAATAAAAAAAAAAAHHNPPHSPIKPEASST
ncbi:hypothetical protein MCAP1_000391 [Malassezia caprae]|uniref:C2H2-type domain-containing protein n=1 Tax=Malassezia caprae TaxID=1381934 RepID=A0AAF0E2E3_9BASI|nr:hypothetical protein MCAP1_000391 [Malassezia caprae]